MNETPAESGGFLPQTLPPPSPSNTFHLSTTSNLPHPRSHPLKPGSAKEETARRYVENRLLHISRRFTKKFQPAQKDETVHGYESVVDVAKDLSEVVDVLWLSGTPNLQIPYLLNVALAVTSYLPAFPPAPIATFSLLRKLDHAFASLMKGEDSVTGESLPGFENGKKGGMSRTDMVRYKSLVESTRVMIVEVMSKEPEVEEATGTDTETDGGLSIDRNWELDDDDGDYEMDVARVYEATIEQLNLLLSGDSGYNIVSNLN